MATENTEEEPGRTRRNENSPAPFLLRLAFSVFSVFSDGQEPECLEGHGWPKEAVVQSFLLMSNRAKDGPSLRDTFAARCVAPPPRRRSTIAAGGHSPSFQRSAGGFIAPPDSAFRQRHVICCALDASQAESAAHGLVPKSPSGTSSAWPAPEPEPGRRARVIRIRIARDARDIRPARTPNAGRSPGSRQRHQQRERAQHE